MRERPHRADHRTVGHAHETQALRWLERQGLFLVASNYHCRGGEIDLVMRDKRTQLLFIEVRYRRRSDFGSAAATVGYRKQQRLRIAARHFLARHPRLALLDCRFDVMASLPHGENEPVQWEWIKNAFY